MSPQRRLPDPLKQGRNIADPVRILKVMLSARPAVHDIGLLAFELSGDPAIGAHLHPELEFNLLLHGAAHYETPAGQWTLPPGRLTAFWGGYPHRLCGSGPLRMLGATLPVSAAGHPVLAETVDALLAGQVLIGAPDEAPADEFHLRRWGDDLASRSSRAIEVCLLEIQARLARLGAGARGRATAPARSRSAERLLAVVARNYTEPLRVADIARRAGVHPTYAARIFRETFGLPLWAYVERLRVGHAQRLLVTSDRPVDRIGHECGYGARSSFLRAFRHQTGQSPAEYRRQRRAADLSWPIPARARAGRAAPSHLCADEPRGLRGGDPT
ncbi:helix-turn-helix domain-containing protein [Micromonospora sp. NPDC051300]|uniref:helix-turn-helix domain-containing protein n=1 Tax=Micromonospora sp. NPDC051300 TaxID=3364286 RepID=UPI0037B1CE26